MMKNIVLGFLILFSMGTGKVQAAYDHQYSDWQRVLSTYTHDGRVNYKALKDSKNALEISISSLSPLYNFFVFVLIVRTVPVATE